MIAVIFCLCALFVLAFWIGKNLLFPPALYSAVWLVSLVGLLLAGDTFFPISLDTAVVFLAGAMAFFAGGVTALALSGPMRMRNERGLDGFAQRHGAVEIRVALDFFLVLVIIGIPIYWNKIGTLSGNTGDAFVLHSIRSAMVDRNNESAPLGIVGNLGVMAYFVALAMAYELDGTFKRAIRMWGALIVSLTYGLMSGSKGSAVILLSAIFFVSWIKTGQFRFGRLVFVMGAIALIFGTGLIFVNLVYLPFANITDAFATAARSMLGYWLGGLVGFDRIVESPNVIESTQPPWRFFLETARSLGWTGYVPGLHAEYSIAGPNWEGNTYTIYFTYFKDYGIGGAIVGMFLLGLIVTWFYALTKRGGATTVLLYSMLCVAMALSFHAEHFLLGLNQYLKALVFFSVIYGCAPYIGMQLRKYAFLHA